MTIVAFKSKTEVFEFAENCSLSGFGGRVVATPKEIKLGCGFSVSINDRYAYNAYALVKRGYYPTFHGVYRIKKDGGRVSLSRLA
ncbi:MAG: putative Se/S carrier-like protein [Candidatus Borkfalkiaceae bacterium]|nr:putative Se/S carrier-like protein [Christensenellaceae bacterium]